MLEAVVSDSKAWLAQASAMLSYNHDLSAKSNRAKLLTMDELKGFMKVLVC